MKRRRPCTLCQTCNVEPNLAAGDHGEAEYEGGRVQLAEVRCSSLWVRQKSGSCRTAKLVHRRGCLCLGRFPCTEAVEGKGFAEKKLDIDGGGDKGFGKHHDEGAYDSFPDCGCGEHGADGGGKADGGLGPC